MLINLLETKKSSDKMECSRFYFTVKFNEISRLIKKAPPKRYLVCM